MIFEPVGREQHVNRKRLNFERLEPRLALAGNPVAEWRFDEASGTVLAVPAVRDGKMLNCQS